MSGGWGRDLAHAARRVAARPGWSAAVVVTLAVGVAAVAVLGSAVRGILLHPLPYAEPERLALLWLHDPKNDVPMVEAAWADFDLVREQAEAFDAVALVTATNFRLNLTGGDQPVQVQGALASAGLFAAVGAEAQVGRTFVAADADHGAAPPVILSDGLWRRQFAADPGIVGSDIELDGDPATVIGIAPPDFALPAEAEVWVPASPPPADPPQARALRVYKLVARRAPGVTAEQAAQDLARLSGRLEEVEPERNRGLVLTAQPLLRAVYGDTRPALTLLTLASALVLLVAAANVAGLLLVGAARRLPELALRGVHGAGPGELARVLLAENLLLGAAAAVAGALLATAALAAWPALAPPDVPFAGEVRLHPATLALCLGVALAAMLACTLPPLARVVRLDLVAVL
ncbi:MAG TPA: ABC transporter permease, partial [Thermoanaerobaculia bacterium]|nr:ABC transporter permease [Thermoanaerobaculia bacterium]